jgi:RNA polymerase sigma factor (sigma-70 family)
VSEDITRAPDTRVNSEYDDSSFSRRSIRPLIASSSKNFTPEFDLIYAREIYPLIKHIQRLGATLDVAQEIAQDTFLKLFQNFSKVRDPRSWLRTVAGRDFCRVNMRVREYPTDEPADNESSEGRPEPELLLSEETMRVNAAIAKLNIGGRQVMAWTLDGYTDSEIAAVLNISEAAVRKRRSRAYAELKKFLVRQPEGQS